MNALKGKREIMYQTKWIVLLAVFFLSYVSFGSIVHFNFAQDDFTILYYVQNNTLLFYPYYVGSLIFIPLYNVFKLNASYYYTVSLLLFTCAGLSLYYFSFVLFKDKIIAFTAVVFFIFSFAGSDALYTMSVGILMSLFLILELWTLSFYIKYQTTKRNKYFYFAFSLYVLALFLFPYRAYVLLLFILLLYFFVRKKRPTVLFVKQVFLLILPYLFVYGLLPYIPFLHTAEHHLPPLFTHLKPESINHVVQTIKNVIIPSTFSFTTNAAYLIFMLIILIVHKNRRILLPLLFLLIPILGFVLIFGENYETFDRYLYVIRPFLALFLAALLFCQSSSPQFSFRRLFIIIIIFPIFLFHTIENVKYQKEIITDRNYSRYLFNTIRSSHPNIQDYTIFFFNSPDVPARNRLSRTTDVGALPHSGSFAVYYKKDYEKIGVVFYCDTYASLLETWKANSPRTIYFTLQGEKLAEKNLGDTASDCQTIE